MAVASAGGANFEAAGPRHSTPARADVPDTFVKFEAMVLQSFLQNMLPEEGDSVFGSGLSGEMWRGMLAQQLGEVMARRGGIGIAERVLGGAGRRHTTLEAEYTTVEEATEVIREEHVVLTFDGKSYPVPETLRGFDEDYQ
jgi:Rod binding domain-containing protein